MKSKKTTNPRPPMLLTLYVMNDDVRDVNFQFGFKN